MSSSNVHAAFTRSKTFNNLRTVFEEPQKNPLNNPNVIQCIFKQAPAGIRPHGLMNKRITEQRTFNSLPLIRDSNTADACVKMIAIDSLLKKGRTVQELFTNLPSTIESNKKSVKSQESERIYNSLERLVLSDEGSVITTRIPKQRPIRAIAEAIERCGSLILPVSIMNDPHHWVVVDNVVKINTVLTAVNPFPVYGIIFRDPIDGIHAIANAGEFVKFLEYNDPMYQLSNGVETPWVAKKTFADKIPLPDDQILQLSSPDRVKMMELNQSLPPTKVQRFLNRAFTETLRPSSVHETPDVLRPRRNSDEGSPSDLSKRLSTISLEGDVVSGSSPTEGQFKFQLSIIPSSQVNEEEK